MKRIYNPITERSYPVRPKKHGKGNNKIKGLWSKDSLGSASVASSKEETK